MIINMWIKCTLTRSLFTPYLTCSLHLVTISDKGWYVRHNTCVSSYSFSGRWNGKHFPCNPAKSKTCIAGNTEQAWLSCAISATDENYKLITESCPNNNMKRKLLNIDSWRIRLTFKTVWASGDLMVCWFPFTVSKGLSPKKQPHTIIYNITMINIHA